MKQEDVVNYKNGETIHYNLSGLTGRGVVRGKADCGNPVIGISYIVEDISGNLPNNVYPFDCFSIPEIFISYNS
jgi:hypothetical protein